MPRILQPYHGHLAPSQSSGCIPVCRMGVGGAYSRGVRGGPQPPRTTQSTPGDTLPMGAGSSGLAFCLPGW